MFKTQVVSWIQMKRTGTHVIEPGMFHGPELPSRPGICIQRPWTGGPLKKSLYFDLQDPSAVNSC